MNICCECGKVFEDVEIVFWRENRGDFGGFLDCETMWGSPCCRASYSEAIKCESCGQYFTLEELDENYLCEDCQKDDEEE